MKASGFEARQKNWARNWLFETALPYWADAGVDHAGGGVFEALFMDGAPCVDMVKRFRVQARQVYSFAHAYKLGWSRGIEALRPPLEFMMRHCWLDQGGWGHLYNRDGSVNDPTLDTYDQAFALLGLGWAYDVTGETSLYNAAKTTMNVVKSRLRHPLIGYAEGVPARGSRRANPHMHLFEVALHWMQLHQDDEMAALAAEIHELFVQKFCVDGLLREYFREDLSPLDDSADPSLLHLEPGHLLEWASLLNWYERLAGVKTASTAVLEAFSDAYAASSDSGLIMDKCTDTGAALETVTSRLWPQTEYIRLKLESGRPGQKQKGLEMLERLKTNFLTVDGQMNGLWHDKVDGRGAIISDRAPASSLYHFIGALLPLLHD